MDEPGADTLRGLRDRLGAIGLHVLEALGAAFEQDADQIDDDIGVTHRRFDRVRKAQIGLNAVDLTDPAACEKLVAKVVDTLGGLHGVITTVGGFAMGKLADTGLDEWDTMFNLNVKTTWNIYRAAAPALKATGGGSLVGIGSVAGLHGGSQMAPYAATKSAVMRLTESLAEELRPDRIRVNAVLPTTIDTPQNRAAMPNANTSRWVKPTEVAEVMLFLLSDAASAVSGALLQVG